MTTLHIGVAAHAEPSPDIAKDFLGDPFPSWTAFGVTELFDPEAVFELSCVAVVGPDGPASRGSAAK